VEVSLCERCLSRFLSPLCRIFLFVSSYVAQQLLVGLGLLIVEVSRSHSDTPHSVGLLWACDQPVAETSTWQYTTLPRDRHHAAGGIRTCSPSKRAVQTHVLDRAATGIYPTQNKYLFFAFSQTSGRYQQVYFHCSLTKSVDVALVWWNSGGLNLCSCVVSVALIR
jgi:hypothetical protein